MLVPESGVDAADVLSPAELAAVLGLPAPAAGESVLGQLTQARRPAAAPLDTLNAAPNVLSAKTPYTP